MSTHQNWDQTTSSDITVSGAYNEVATKTTSNESYIRGTVGESSGKWYWEIVCTKKDAYNNGYFIVGVVDQRWANPSWPGDFGLVYYPGGTIAYRDAGGTVQQPSAAAYGIGDTVSIALDAASAKVWVRVNGGPWNNTTDNPATNTGGFALPIGPTIYPFFGSSDPTPSNDIATANFGDQAYSYAMPTGFSSFNSNTVNIGAASLTIGIEPVAANLFLPLAPAALALTPKALGVNAALNLPISTAALTVNGQPLSLNVGLIVGIGSVALALTGKPLGIDAGLTLGLNSAALMTTGNAVPISFRTAIDSTALVLSGAPTVANIAAAISPAPLSLTPESLLANEQIAIGAASLSITPDDVQVNGSNPVSIDAVALMLTPGDVSAIFATSFAVFPSGGISVSGAAQYVERKNVTMSGGVQTGGAAAVRSTRTAPTPSGGVQVVGSAFAYLESAKLFTYFPNGGVQIEGSSVITTGRIRSGPQWITPAGALASVAENIAVDIQLLAVDPENQPITFSVIAGALPPGLSLSSTGEITGTPSNLPHPGPDRYDVIIRAANPAFAVDRNFTLDVRTDVTVLDWDYTLLPSPKLTPVTYYLLGTPAIGSAFSYELPLIGPEQDDMLFTIQPVGALGNAGPFNGMLPPGLVVNVDQQWRMNGVIEFDEANTGLYFLQIVVSDDDDPTAVPTPPLVLAIDVQPAAATVNSPIVLAWKTPEGRIGTIVEGAASDLSVRATATGNVKITYSVSPDSGDLPTGIIVDEDTGDLVGVAGYVTETADYTITIRASAETLHIDRDFIVTVVSRYNSAEVADVQLVLLGPLKRNWVQHYAAQIPTEQLYRPHDPNFGLVTQPTVYVVNGLSTVSDTIFRRDLFGGTLEPDHIRRDYHGAMRLGLGRHRVAVVRGNDGKVIYEVIYRELIDPQAKAGGFASDSTIPQERDIPYRHQPNYYHIEDVYPNSLRNARLDLINEEGFATNDAAMRHLPGPSGIEGMPKWMIAPQVADDPSSIVGYVPAIVIAYVQPGTGADLVSSLRAGGFLRGFTIDFDRYLVNGLVIVQTTFDGGSTTFDGIIGNQQPTTFDESIAPQGKYFKLT